MTWLAWRQARTQLLTAAVAVALVVAVLAATRGRVAATPGDLSTPLESLQLLGTALIGVPAAIGAFWGAPLLARELETGTHRLAWTQGVTRRRWLALKLTLLGAAAAAMTAVFTAAFTWWSLPLDATGNRIGTANFGQRGIAPIAYAMFALALGTLIGALVRRTLPAIAFTLVGFFVVRYSFQLLVRPRLVDTVELTRSTTMVGPGNSASTAGSWVLSSSTVDATGKALSGAGADRLMVDTCHLTRLSTADDWASCAHRIRLHDVVKAHPASHFWPLQLLESAAFGALTVALVAMCFWWVRHRTA
ncbi:MAG: ABC transporter permease subunit [Acidimicrobiales bacterium]